jgi:predicted nuclease of predicted toxin-antitoxin system
MKILIDMNLPPRRVDFLAGYGISATHWSDEGDMKAPDSEVLMWARARNHVVFTHDLDFGVLLSMTQEAGPSVIQVSTQDVTPEAIGSLVVAALQKHGEALDRGAILSIQQQTARVRVLPIKKAGPEEPLSGR